MRSLQRLKSVKAIDLQYCRKVYRADFRGLVLRNSCGKTTLLAYASLLFVNLPALQQYFYVDLANHYVKFKK